MGRGGHRPGKLACYALGTIEASSMVPSLPGHPALMFTLRAGLNVGRWPVDWRLPRHGIIFIFLIPLYHVFDCLEGLRRGKLDGLGKSLRS